MQFLNRFKEWFTTSKMDVEFATDNFKDHCIDQWYLFLEESFRDVIKSVGFAIAWLIFTNYIFMGGLIGTIIFGGLALGAILYIIQPILNIFIMGLRCLGAKIKYI
jgi:hypothetical protein